MNNKIQINFNCPEDWNRMKIAHNTRFCENCQKNVIDFTKMSREEILEYLITRRNEKVCGRIYRSQLDYSDEDFLVTIQNITQKNNDSNLAFYLLTAGALFLSSCSTANKKNIKDTQIDSTINTTKIESCSSSIEKDSIKMGFIAPIIEDAPTKDTITRLMNNESNIKNDSLNLNSIDEEGFSLPTEKKVIEDTRLVVGNMKLIPYAQPNEPYLFAEKMPEFIGGIDSLQIFIERNLIYPKWEIENKIEGKVYASFVVTKDGKTIKPQILKSVKESKNFDSEVIRIIKLMPDWIPGEQDGQKVDVKFTLPINFKL